VIGVRTGGKTVNMMICSSYKLTERTTRVDDQATYCYEAIWYENKREENKVCGISRKGNIKVCLLIDDQQVKQVSQFKYLASWISDYALRTYKQHLEWARHCSAETWT